MRAPIRIRKLPQPVIQGWPWELRCVCGTFYGLTFELTRRSAELHVEHLASWFADA
jgi:hypothetical protein